MKISLSILEYEQSLYNEMEFPFKSEVFSRIIDLINTGQVDSIHIDVMRPPLIPNRIVFPLRLIRELYEALHERIPFSFHLMVSDPLLMIKNMDEFIPKVDRADNAVIIQRESFNSEDEMLDAICLLRRRGYKRIGVCLDLPTPCGSVSEKSVEAADFILLMTVHMGRGRQRYSDAGTEKIKYFSRRYPDKPLWVDGGINIRTAQIVKRAGAETLVVGSFITLNDNPVYALIRLAQSVNDI
ncbi:hypothetical protein DRO37_02180 [Candidatus Bathyarchaeota archaeon]|nr:MAG: hypothetical protein DRO37_02180 [Candidatus Bathyarchaeota archaeon]